MFEALINRFSLTLNILLWENRIKIIDNNGAVLFDDIPIIAIETKENGEDSIVEVGKNAALHTASNIKISKPFSNSRILIDDFEIAALILRYAIEKGSGRKGFFSPKIIIEVMRKFENGLTQVEKQVLNELVSDVGAREVILKD